MDERAQALLNLLVERYISDGQPVGSRTLSKTPGMVLSAATIRNIMADLEELGLIASPHTSAGRIPTARGYRFFVDTLLTARGRDGQRGQVALPPPLGEGGQPQKVISQAAQVLSQLSSLVGVVTAPKRSSIFRHIEFLRLSERRVLVILVTPDGDVQNRVVLTPRDFTQTELIEASNQLNERFTGVALDTVRQRLQGEVEELRSEISSLMHTAVHSSEPASDAAGEVVVSGEHNLLDVQDFGQNLQSLRRMFDLFEKKTELMRLLDGSSRAEGVRIYIGGESQVVPFEELSVVSAPYRVDGEVVGTVGVIGPTRMAYERMIEIVDITARLVGNALSQKG
ncbi:heat-inducible transcriptional repressor HrcA [Amphibiibacter pelophylacis]|uniref:Heat-inducible transcriptional repressor HrcA n=1 Tax=Amphibiibacter pelophylacis TaxID=1799477 RepID=A0ACC6P3F5_9BURK